jgi:ABC-type polysaccharide/polyol phosphate transport system ATPase subunit
VRDNVRLAAAIFAIPLQKIDFASILALAELEGREETVLEALSWGTQSRLFAAVVLEAMARDAADVFLFDEWLTGVDRSFGKRIVNRLSQLSSNSQTVLLASHDLEFLEQVCDRCILLDGGKFVRSASASEIIAAYRKRSDSA